MITVIAAAQLTKDDPQNTLHYITGPGYESKC